MFAVYCRQNDTDDKGAASNTIGNERAPLLCKSGHVLDRGMSSDEKIGQVIRTEAILASFDLVP
jgi:hypothetical protein